MKLAILGGSFNPVHIGHLFLADSVLTGMGYDRVILVPTFQSPFKISADGASADDRFEMLAASITGDPRLTIDDCEIKREGVSYTADTLEDIISRYQPSGKPGLILGDDLVSTFHKWRNPEKIIEMADIILARRLSKPAAGADSSAEWLPDTDTCSETQTHENMVFPYPHLTLNNEIIDLSSSLVREKISRDENWHFLVPPGARFIIEEKGLYGFSRDKSAFGMDEKTNPGIMDQILCIENDVRAIQGPSRFLHSRNTALLSWDLCRRFGLDPQKGYLAGIAHDMCKTLSDEELIQLARSDGGSISKLEKNKPGLLHARAAAVRALKKYGVTDRTVLEAIQHHTTGARDMGPLAKVVYIADKIEVTRVGIDPALRELTGSIDLDVIFSVVLNNTVAYLKSHQKEVSYSTRMLLAAMDKRNHSL